MSVQNTENKVSFPVISTSIDALAWNSTGARLAISVSQLYDGPVPASGFTQIIDMGTNQVLFATDYYGKNVHWIFTEGREDLLIVSALGGIRHYNGDNYQLIREFQNRNDREWYGLIGSFINASDNTFQMHLRHLTDVQEYLIGQNISSPEDTLIVPINTDSAVPMRLNWIGSNPATQVIAGAGSDGLVRVWTEVSQLPTHVIVVSSGDELLSGDFTSDGRFLAIGGRDRYLTIIDTLTYSISARIETDSTVDRIAWHPDGRQIAIGSSGIIWNVETQTINLQLANNFVTAIAWNSTGQLAAGLHFDSDGTITGPTDNLSLLGSFLIETIPPQVDPTPTPTATPAPFQRLRLTSLCSDNPAQYRVWRVRNFNADDVVFTWDVYNSPSGQNGFGVAPPASGTTPGVVTFITQTEPGPNTVRLFVDGAQQDVKASSSAQC